MLRWSVRAREALKQNKGSSIVTVLVTMMFVTILGVTLLSMTYTGLLVQSTDRKGETNFYSATEVLDQIQAGFQEAASEAIEAAYQDVLTNYNTYSAEIAALNSDLDPDNDTTIDERFAEKVKAEFDNIKVTDAKGENPVSLKDERYGTAQYNVDAIVNMFSKANVTAKRETSWGTVLEVGAEDDGKEIVVTLGAEKKGTGTWVYYQPLIEETVNHIVFKGFQVSYTGEDGYNTIVSADISIEIPSFHLASASGFEVNQLSEYVLVANDTLKDSATGDTKKVNGSVYGGTIDLTSGERVDNEFYDGIIVSPGKLLLSGAKTATFNEDTNLWTNDINVGLGTTVNLNGTSYVQDDLDISGVGATVNLNNEYYGFGDSNNESAVVLGEDEKSSAILVNAEDTTLNLSTVKELMLAGHGFIGSESSVMMGESISVKTNQKIYMAPIGAIDSATTEDGTVTELTNPYIGKPITSFVPNAEEIILEVDGEKTLEDYGAKVVSNSIPLNSGQTVTYFYLQFDTVANANQYFKDYFTGQPEEITDYLEIYTTLSQVPDEAITSGHFIEQDGSDYSLGTSVGVVEPGDIEEISETYKALCQNLTLEYSAAKEELTPFNSAIHGKNINKLIGENIASEQYEETLNTTVDGEIKESRWNTFGHKVWEFKDEEGNVRALLVTGSGTFSLENSFSWLQYDNVNAIIGVGDISIDVDRDYEGIVLSANDIIMSASNITASEEMVLESYNATIESNGITVEFRQLLEIANIQQDAVTGSESWEMADLVSYVNWNER